MSTVPPHTTGSVASPGHPRKRLWWQLTRMGFTAGRGTPGDRLRFWALFAAAASVAFVVLAGVAAAATYDGREARSQARGPVLTERAQDAVALWREGLDMVGEVQHSVIYVHPLKAATPPPPGLTRWPAPGEAVLSPELERLGAKENITSRYGRHAGTIGASGLVSPSERFAYVRPLQAPDARQRESWFPIDGFGQPYPMGEILDSRPLSHVLLSLGALTGVPAVALLVVAARVGSRTRDRRSGLLQSLGGTWRHRALVNAGEAALPVATGTLAAVLPMLVACSVDLRIPGTGYLLNSEDLQGAWPAAVGALALSFVLTLGAVIALHRVQRDGTATRPRSFASSIPRWRLAGCGVGIGVVALSQYLGGTSGLAAFVVGTVAMWAFLPSVAAATCKRLGAALAARGFGAGRPGQLIGGRWTAAHPGVVVRLVLAMIIGLGLISQLQVWNSRLGEQAAAARSSQARVGDTVLTVRSGDVTGPDVARLEGALPAGARLLTMTTGDAPLLQGTCAVLRTLALDCPTTPATASGGDRRVGEIRKWYGSRLQIQATPTTPPPDPVHGTLVAVTDAPGQGPAIKQAAYTVVPAVNVESLGENWVAGSATKARLNNWVLLFGSAGLALLLLAGGMSAAAEFVRVRHVLAPLAVLTGHHGVFRSVAFWHLTVPLLISAVLAAAVTAWHSVFFVAVVQEGSFSWTVLGWALVGCALLAAAVGALGSRSAVRAAGHWRPAAD